MAYGYFEVPEYGYGWVDRRLVKVVKAVHKIYFTTLEGPVIETDHNCGPDCLCWEKKSKKKKCPLPNSSP